MAVVIRSAQGEELKLNDIKIPYIEVRSDDNKLSVLFIQESDDTLCMYTPEDDEFHLYASRFGVDTCDNIELRKKS